MDIDQLNEFLRASKTVLDIFKSLGSILPKGPQSDAAREQLAQAEKALKATEAQFAKGLGYHLCKCTFPPQIMLRIRRHEKYGEDIFRCKKCGNQEPSEHHFRQMEMIDAHNRGLRGSSLLGP